MFNQFKNIYAHMIYESGGSLKISIIEYIQLLKKSNKFNENGLLTEDKKLLIDIPNETLIYLMQNLSGNFLNTDIFKNTFKTSKHWKNIKNINFNKIFFKCFDFNDNYQIDSLHYKFFSITQNDDLILMRKAFKENTFETFGFYLTFNNNHLLCVNDKSSNIENTLYHEISHFIQNVCNIRIVKSTIDEKNLNKLNSIIGTDLNQCLNYFSEKEFIPSINDLLKDLANTKNLFYQNISNIEYVFLIKNYLKNVYISKNMHKDFFFAYLKANHNNYYPLSFLITSYILQYKYQFIEQKILNFFKN